MTRVHYFQRYSHRENLDTNNTLLLLARIQAHDPRLLRDVLGELLCDAELGRDGLEVGVQFSQQTTAPAGSVPDGMLYQKSFRVVIETKRHGDFRRDQLEAHLSAFGNETTRILLLLAPVRDEQSIRAVKGGGVNVVGRTFSDIIQACDEAGLRSNHELREIIDDYESFCHESGLVSDESDRLMVVPAGESLRENVKLKLVVFTKSLRLSRPWERHRLGLLSCC